MSFIFRIAALAFALLLGACGTTPEPAADDSSAPSDVYGGGADGSGFDTSGQQTPDSTQGQSIEDAQADRDAQLRQQTIIYFEFDSSEIRADFMPAIEAHARYLRGNPSVRLRLEGHADERGTREYNIGLGERRAEAIRRALLLRGASRSQLLVVSYGEEQPAVLGSGERAWAQNRRVELVYQ